MDKNGKTQIVDIWITDYWNTEIDRAPDYWNTEIDKATDCSNAGLDVGLNGCNRF